MQITTTLFVATWLLMVGVPSWAQSKQQHEFCDRPLRVALVEFGLLYRSATQDGIDARVLDVLEKRTGCKLIRVSLPRARIWAELKTGTVDMATAAVSTPEREAYAYMLPYLQLRNVVLVRSEVAKQVPTQKAFESSALRIGVVRSFRHEPAFDALIANMHSQKRVVETSDIDDLMRMLQRRVVDAILCPPILHPETLKQQLVVRDWAPKEQMVLANLTLTHKAFTLEQAEHWNEVLETIRKDGTLHSIANAFLVPADANNLFYTGTRQRLAAASP
jgi:polar amino acid transport system substrate-binding protein